MDVSPLLGSVGGAGCGDDDHEVHGGAKEEEEFSGNRRGGFGHGGDKNGAGYNESHSMWERKKQVFIGPTNKSVKGELLGVPPGHDVTIAVRVRAFFENYFLLFFKF